jgi:hypothetical protein
MNNPSEFRLKFENTRNLLKNILNVYLEESFFKPAIDACFLNDDINFEEVLKLSKVIKINVYVKAYVYIIKNVLCPKLKQIDHFEELYNKISDLNFDFVDEEELYEFAETIKTDENNLINMIFTEVLAKCEEINEKFGKMQFENNNLKINNKNLESKLNKIEKEFEEEITRSKDFLVRHNEITEKLQISHEKEIETLTQNYNSILNEHKNKIELLQEEAKKLETQKYHLKKHSEDTIFKLKEQWVDTDQMIDKRLIANCVLKYFDKKNKDKKIQQIVLDTLANYLEFNNDERKLIGLTPSNLSSKYHSTTAASVKIKEVSENFINFLTQV